MSNSSVTKIPCTLLRFFKYWLQFTEPLHKLQTKEIEVFAYILRKRYELSKIIKEEALLDEYLLSSKVRKEINEEIGITIAYSQVIMSNLRKKGAITEDNRINKKFIPDLQEDSQTFNLMFTFDIGNDSSN